MRTVLIGAGKVGSQLGAALVQAGIEIVQVFSRKKTKANKLAKRLGCEGIHQIGQIDAKASLYIIAVKDDAILTVSKQLSKLIEVTPLVVHTSGATPGQLLKGQFKRYGVFYPLQTFSEERPVDFQQIPICINANRKADRQLLQRLAEKISQKVYEIDDQQRAVLHVAAVFVNNFSNYMYQIGEQITSSEQLPFDLLKPLIAETARKIEQHSPVDMQTGPAIRNDQQTIDRHLEYLEKFPDYRNLYHIFTEQIKKQ